MPGCEVKGNQIRCRIASPKKFDAKSFRTKSIGKGRQIIIGCPRGHFKRNRCAVGMRAQSIRYPNTAANRKKLKIKKK